MTRRTHSSNVLASVWVTLVAAIALPVLGQPAQAALITRNVGVTLTAENIESFDLDVDLNGTTDFTFTAALVLDPVLSVGFDVVVFPFGSTNGVVIDAFTADGFPAASILGAGDTVSDADAFAVASFDQGNLFFFVSGEPPTGNFLGRTGFLGLRFDRPGGSVFGFAQITVNDLDAPINPLGLTIGTVGFNDVPGQPAQITAVPAPASVTFLGVSMLGLLAARRKEER